MNKKQVIKLNERDLRQIISQVILETKSPYRFNFSRNYLDKGRVPFYQENPKDNHQRDDNERIYSDYIYPNMADRGGTLDNIHQEYNKAAEKHNSRYNNKSDDRRKIQYGRQDYKTEMEIIRDYLDEYGMTFDDFKKGKFPSNAEDFKSYRHEWLYNNYACDFCEDGEVDRLIYGEPDRFDEAITHAIRKILG